MSTRSGVCAMAALVVTAATATACIPHYDATGLQVDNQSGRTFWVDDEPCNPVNRRLKVPVDRSVLLDEKTAQPDAEGCGRGLEAQTEDGTVLVSLKEGWQTGQTWRVLGEGDAELLDAE